MKIARVFPRRTKATPDDALAFVGEPDIFMQPGEVDKVKISVTFTWDLPEAQRLALAWGKIAPVEIGGPGAGMRGENFTPGEFLKRGYIITSRGCPNRCWFCSVWRREDEMVRELPITEGYNLLDDNLLACSDKHFSDVLEMLARQKELIEFTGGLEAKRFQFIHAIALRRLRIGQIFFAYDEPADWEPLVLAAKICWRAGFQRDCNRKIRCYVLIGYPKDTLEAAEIRLRAVLDLGVFPMAMLWRNERGEMDLTWRRFQRLWARPAVIASMAKH